MITMVIADDQEVARAGVLEMMAEAPDIKVVGVAEDGKTAQRLVARLHPHVLLLDLMMPGPRPAEIVLWVNSHYPETAVLVLTAHDRDYYLAQMLETGAAGYLDKNVRAQQLTGAIRAAAIGQRLFTREQQHRAQVWRTQVQERWESLTCREREVLRLICLGLPNREIAQTLTISENTVETHIGNILSKVGVESRAKVIVWAMKNKVLDINGQSPESLHE